MKKVFFEILQNSQENTCARAEISKNTFSYRAPPVAASQLKNQRSWSKTVRGFSDILFLIGIMAF